MEVGLRYQMFLSVNPAEKMMNAAYSLLFIALPLASAVSISAVRPASGCLPGSTSFEGSCYIFPVLSVSWPDAVSICRLFGAHIVEINSRAENDFLVSQLKERKISVAWIGANDLLEEGIFRWGSSRENVSLSYWRAGEPNNVGPTSQCANIVAEWNYDWNDGNCHDQNRIVCEKLK
ncbi:hypothetical protein BsWGS_24834 [Bradybaena similaris]